MQTSGIGTYKKAASELHCKNQSNHMELLLNFFYYHYLVLDKICFKESVVHPNNWGGSSQGFSVWFLNFFFRQHLEVAWSSWWCFSEITSKAGSFSLEVQQCLDSIGNSSAFARFLFWINNFVIHWNNRAGIVALHDIPGYICLKISCFQSFFIFCYWDMVPIKIQVQLF